MSISRVGFLGLGTMGAPMAKNLKKKGFQVVVWNRSPERAEALKADGIEVAASPAALAAQVDAYCTCVADPAALEGVAAGLLENARPGQLFIDFSTVSVPLIESLAARFAAKGVDFADAPVTGSRSGAEKGTLVIMTGCSAATLARATPIFEAVGEKVIHCGEVGTGTQVKLAGNALIAGMLQCFSEGLLLTKVAGVDPRKLIEVVQASGFRSPYFEFKGKAMLERDFTTHFSIDLMHKDLSLFLDNAAAHRVPTPTAASLRETYNLARASGHGGQDISAVITAFEDLVGTKVS
ncbi:MAG: NAD(P)-dependent oxidoreductase [Archangium sp.]|nr:NAD(P)-dependent oxidoreductase [Archangium sp.]MDP3153878.1 NAD(P)-dependent oxidoreductase [Archangium sp.]MDP3576082.1 NAD(P)-dependent oxidoreductase [Archangium sp.]